VRKGGIEGSFRGRERRKEKASATPKSVFGLWREQQGRGSDRKEGKLGAKEVQNVLKRKHSDVQGRGTTPKTVAAVQKGGATRDTRRFVRGLVKIWEGREWDARKFSDKKLPRKDHLHQTKKTKLWE